MVSNVNDEAAAAAAVCIGEGVTRFLRCEKGTHHKVLDLVAQKMQPQVRPTELVNAELVLPPHFSIRDLWADEAGELE